MYVDVQRDTGIDRKGENKSVSLHTHTHTHRLLAYVSQKYVQIGIKLIAEHLYYKWNFCFLLKKADLYNEQI